VRRSDETAALIREMVREHRQHITAGELRQRIAEAGKLAEYMSAEMRDRIAFMGADERVPCGHDDCPVCFPEVV
jgi:hypothetical protein